MNPCEQNRDYLVRRLEQTGAFLWLAWFHFHPVSRNDLISSGLVTGNSFNNDTPAYIVTRDGLIEDEPFETLGYFLYLVEEDMLLELQRELWEQSGEIAQAVSRGNWENSFSISERLNEVPKNALI